MDECPTQERREGFVADVSLPSGADAPSARPNSTPRFSATPWNLESRQGGLPASWHQRPSVRPSVPSSFIPASPSSRTGTGRVCCPRNEPAGTLTTPASGERLISSRGIDSVYMCRDNVHRTFPNRHITMCLDFGQHKGRPCGRRLTRNPPWKCFCGVCVQELMLSLHGDLHDGIHYSR